MQITGSWRLYVRPGWGQDADWDNLPTIMFADGRITLDDGSHPDFFHEKGALRFSFPVAGGVADRRIANIMINRGTDGYPLRGLARLARFTARLPPELARARRRTSLSHAANATRFSSK